MDALHRRPGLREWLEQELGHLNARLDKLEEKLMAAIDDLQTADTSLQATVSQVLTDYAAALTAAEGDPAKVEQVVTDMQAMSAQLTSADPATPSAPPAAS